MSIENIIYRKPTCPWGQKAIDLLKKENISFKESILSDENEVNAFKQKHEVKTTPQIFFGNERIGGYTELAEKLGRNTQEEEKKTYQPIIAVFSVSLALAAATHTSLQHFMGYFLSLLACLKLMDIRSFVTGFKNYDLITSKVPFYGFIYPFAELAAGLGFLSGIAPLATASIATFVGITGGVSIVKAVYIDKKDLNCACIGGNSNVPLGAVSFLENFSMAAMGIWLLISF